MEKTEFKIFNESNGVFTGVNTPQFSQLEYLAEMCNTSGCQLPHLGLFGEASTGKTTSTTLLAKGCNYKLIVYNAADFKSLSLIVAQLTENWYKTGRGLVRYKDAAHIQCEKTIVLLDEAHKLKLDIQTSLLSSLENPGPLDDAMISVLSNNITFVLATTDPSNIIYPLLTRLHPITFDQYSITDVAHILKLKYPMVEQGGLELLAKTAKLVPRIAMRNANLLIGGSKNKELITTSETEKFITGFLGMETNGIDQLDKRILAYLSSYKKQVAPVDQIAFNGFTKIKAMLEAKGINKLSPQEHKEYNRATFQIVMLTEKLNSAESLPKSRQDISLACRLLDLADLETRLSYLEKLNYITKTSRGIVIAKEYR